MTCLVGDDWRRKMSAAPLAPAEIFSTFPQAISWRRMRFTPANDHSFEPGFHGEFKYRIKERKKERKRGQF